MFEIDLIKNWYKMIIFIVLYKFLVEYLCKGWKEKYLYVLCNVEGFVKLFCYG